MNKENEISTIYINAVDLITHILKQLPLTINQQDSILSEINGYLSESLIKSIIPKIEPSYEEIKQNNELEIAQELDEAVQILTGKEKPKSEK